MIFILFLLLSVTIANIFVSMFFPYHLALTGMGLQFLLFLASFFLFLSRIKKRRKIIGSFIVTSLHGSAFVLIIYIFFNITLPNRDKSDVEASKSAFTGIWKYFKSPDNDQEKSVQNKDIENTSPDVAKPREEKQSAPAALVEDPF